MGRKKKSFTLLPLKDVDGKEHKEIEFSLWRNGIFPEIDSMTEKEIVTKPYI